MTHYLYKIVNLLNPSKIYIGQAQDPHQRIKDHKKASTAIALREDIKLLGVENFSFTVAPKSTESQEEINNWEINNIIKFDSIEKGYNTAGGGVFNRLVRHCEDCGVLLANRDLKKDEPGSGVVAWKTSENDSKQILELKVLCHNCYIKFSELLPQFKILGVNTFGYIYRDFKMIDELAYKHLMVDGRLDTFFSYLFFQKKQKDLGIKAN